MTDGSVSGVSQAYTPIRSMKHCSKFAVQTHQDIIVRRQITRLRNRLEGGVSFLIVRVVLRERTAEYMRAYNSENA